MEPITIITIILFILIFLTLAYIISIIPEPYDELKHAYAHGYSHGIYLNENHNIQNKQNKFVFLTSTEQLTPPPLKRIVEPLTITNYTLGLKHALIMN
jgi:hypothetical protein